MIRKHKWTTINVRDETIARINKHKGENISEKKGQKKRWPGESADSVINRALDLLDS